MNDSYSDPSCPGLERPSLRRCAITGTNGYLGSRAADYFALHGWKVYRFSRRGENVIPFALSGSIAPEVFSTNRIEVLIHCAYDFTLTNWSDIHRVNVQGSVRLLQAAKNGGVRILIFISSMSAYEGCKSLYGKAKLEIEAAVHELGAFIVRPGLIFGEQPGGMVGALTQTLAKSSLLPLIGNGQYVLYQTHEEDLGHLLLEIAEGKVANPLVPILAANEQGKKFRDILDLWATSLGKKIRFVPVPWTMAWLALKTLETLGYRPGFRSDSVLSLVHQDRHPDFRSTQNIGCRFRALEFPKSVGPTPAYTQVAR